LKGDVQGSIEAITQSLEKLSTEKVKITIIHSGAGAITDGDVNLADASDAIIIGFNVRPEPSAAELAREQGVEIKLYQLIFELLDQVKLAMKGMLEPVYKEIQHGRAEVRQVFKVSKVGNVAGCFVTSGNIYSTDRARLIRDGVVVYTGKILSLRRVKDNVSSVSETQECGISLDKFRDVKEGDIIETYFLEEIPQEL
ncbi:MAG TPA: translation initiation factor IF-2, partial [Candidatus Sumerlaeota bacterium]|nr:translation initiation factor IF-2 [Candidatus Sumerlaeota bacterium]